jgi:uncharacterized protein (TIGR02246 family)
MTPVLPPSGRYVRIPCRSRALCSVLATSAALAALVGAAESAEERSRDKQAIRAAAQAYQDALGRGDAQAMAALWTPDGDIIDDGGRVLAGRTTASLAPPSAQPAAGGRPDVTVRETAIRFLTDDVAIEDGTVEVRLPGAAPLEGRFSATWVRHEGGWKLAALRESRGEEPLGAERLADLDWMVGDWSVVDEGATAADGAAKPTIDLTVRWNTGRTFLLRDMTIIAPGAKEPAVHITQRIGWDPLSRSLRSWGFSSDGGHGEATWIRDGGSWVARTAFVQPDGSQTSTLNIYTYDGKDRCTWRSLPTHVGGEHTPQVNKTLIRKPQGAGR